MNELGVLAAAGGLLFGYAAAWWWFRRQWGAPLKEIDRVLGQWAQGDLTEPVSAERLGPARRLAGPLERARAEQWRCFNEGLREVTLERLRLEALVRHFEDGVVLCNLRGEVLRLNPAAQRLLGIAMDDLSGVNTPEARAEVQRVLSSHTQSELVEMPRAGWPGAAAYVSVSVLAPGHTDDVSVLLILRDASARKRLDRVNEEFFQSVAEQLRAPVSALKGYLDLLENSLKPDKRQRGYLDAIAQSRGDLAASLEDALDSARIDMGQLSLSAMPVDPAELLRRAAEPFKPRAQDKGVRLELKIADDRPSSLDVDERLIGRLLERLLVEALAAARRGGSVEFGLAAVGPSQAQIWVAILSAPIAAAGAAAAFEAAASKKAAPVKELPRAVEFCRKVARLHGGDLDAEPARWTVRLPIRQWPARASGLTGEEGSVTLARR